MSLTGYYDQSYPPSLWGGGTLPSDDKTDAKDDDVFFEPTVTAQDAPNAAKLTPLGFIANPLTAWPTGAGIYVNSNYRFHWTGTAWAAGLATVVADEESQPSAFTATPIERAELPEDIQPEETEET